jgi:hypothetical protein
VDTITELFARDPLELSKQDIDKIIEYNFAKRMEHQATGRAPKKETTEIDLKKLGLL